MGSPRSDVTVYVVDCEAAEVVALREAYRAMLPPNELSRVDGLLRPSDRMLHLVSSALLRWGLSRHLGIPPAQVPLTRTRLGKPELAGPVSHSKIAFNVSQSHRFAAAAFAHDGLVGVDIERIDPRIDVAEHATHTFSIAERARMSALSEGDMRPFFFSVWTFKEAFAKAVGTGFETPFDTFSALPTSDGGARLEGVDPAGWFLRAFDVADGYRGAVAIRWNAHQAVPPTIDVQHIVPVA